MDTSPHRPRGSDSNDGALNTAPPMSVADVLDKTDGVYFCIKNHDSVFLWVNQNFADLVGQSKHDLIGSRDSRAAHVAHDQAVMKSGRALLNFHETIDIAGPDGGTESLEITTQKGLLRKKGGTDIIGITVCFSERFPDAVQAADALIAQLKLVPTGIGGYLAPGPGGNSTLLHAALPERFEGDRQTYSSNYFLLKAGEVLQLHALNQDEQWFFHQGSAIRLHVFSDAGVYTSIDIGADLDQGQSFHGVAPGQHWFGAELLGPGYGLVSCSLAPAWDRRDSSRPDAAQQGELRARFPAQAELIGRLATPS